MKRTLIILPGSYSTYFRAKGLSIKAAGYAGHDLCKDESGYFIENRFRMNPITASISRIELVKYLTQLHKDFYFDKIKIKGRYEASAHDIMKEVIKTK